MRVFVSACVRVGVFVCVCVCLGVQMREGKDVTIVAFSRMVQFALEVRERETKGETYSQKRRDIQSKRESDRQTK